MAVADVLSDRYCLKKIPQATISPQYLIDCGEPNGCTHGTTNTAWSTLNTNGAPTPTCLKLQANQNRCPMQWVESGETDSSPHL